jgi:hypothetical protein
MRGQLLALWRVEVVRSPCWAMPTHQNRCMGHPILRLLVLCGWSGLVVDAVEQVGFLGWWADFLVILGSFGGLGNIL